MHNYDKLCMTCTYKHGALCILRGPTSTYSKLAFKNTLSIRCDLFKLMCCLLTSNGLALHCVCDWPKHGISESNSFTGPILEEKKKREKKLAFEKIKLTLASVRKFLPNGHLTRSI